MQTQQQYQGAYQEPCLTAGSAVGRQPGVGDGAACRHIHTAQAAAAVHWFMITVPADVHTYLAFVHSNHVSKQAVGISVCARMPHYLHNPHRRARRGRPSLYQRWAPCWCRPRAGRPRVAQAADRPTCRGAPVTAGGAKLETATQRSYAMHERCKECGRGTP